MKAPLNECNQWLRFWEISNFSHRRCEFLTRRIPQTNSAGSRTAPACQKWMGFRRLRRFRLQSAEIEKGGTF